MVIEDIKYVKEALQEVKEYDSKHPSITAFENFLFDWVYTSYLTIYDRKVMELIYIEFQNMFPYTGVAYRGIAMREEDYDCDGIRSGTLVSFSEERDVAERFANDNEGNLKVIFEVDLKEALSLDELLLAVKKKTQDSGLRDLIEENYRENEKIAYLNIDDCDIEELKPSNIQGKK